MVNSRCEKVELGEGWLGRVAGRWARGQKFLDAFFFYVHDQLAPHHPFLLFSTPFAYLYDAHAFAFLYDQF
jgi:hypothetical protein